MKKITILTVLTLVFLQSFAQSKKLPKEIVLQKEIELTNSLFDKSLLEYYGLVLAFYNDSKDKNEEGKKTIEFKKYDIDLKEEFTNKIAISKFLNFYEKAVDDEALYYLFSDRYNYIVLKYNFINNKITTYEGKLNYSGQLGVNNGMVSVFGENIPNQKVHKTVFWLTAPLLFTPMIFYPLKRVPVIHNIDMTGENSNFLQEHSLNYLKPKFFSFTGIQSNKELNELNFFADYYISSENKVSLRAIKDNKISKDVYLKSNIPKTTFTPTYIKTINENEKLVLGELSSNKNENNGLFIASISNNKQTFFKGVQWKKLKSLEDLKIKNCNFRYQVNKIIKKEGQTVFCLQVYHVLMKQKVSPIPGEKAFEFDANQYIGAIMIAISDEGELLWDKSFKCDDVFSKTPIYIFGFSEVENGNYEITNHKGFAIDIITFNPSKNKSTTREVVINEEDRPEKQRKKIFGFGATGFPSLKTEIYNWYDDIYIAMDEFENTVENGKKVKKKVLSIMKVESNP